MAGQYSTGQRGASTVPAGARHRLLAGLDLTEDLLGQAAHGGAGGVVDQAACDGVVGTAARAQLLVHPVEVALLLLGGEGGQVDAGESHEVILADGNSLLGLNRL